MNAILVGFVKAAGWDARLKREGKRQKKLIGLGRDVRGPDSQPAPGDTSYAAAAQSSSGSSGGE